MKEFVQNITQREFTDEEYIEYVNKEGTFEELWEKSERFRDKVPIDILGDSKGGSPLAGKGLHDAEWWNTLNIADFEDAFIKNYQAIAGRELTEEEIKSCKANARDYQLQVIGEAQEQNRETRKAIFNSKTKSVEQEITDREGGASIKNPTGELHSIAEANPTAKLYRVNGEVNFEYNGEVIDRKKISNYKSVLRHFAKNYSHDGAGQVVMIAQTGTKMEDGQVVPVYTASLVHTNPNIESKGTDGKVENSQKRMEKTFRDNVLLLIDVQKVLAGESPVAFKTLTREVAVQLRDQLLDPGKNGQGISINIGDAKSNSELRNLYPTLYMKPELDKDGKKIMKENGYPKMKAVKDENGNGIFKQGLNKSSKRTNGMVPFFTRIYTNDKITDIQVEWRDYMEEVKANIATQHIFVPIQSVNGEIIYISDVLPNIYKQTIGEGKVKIPIKNVSYVPSKKIIEDNKKIEQKKPVNLDDSDEYMRIEKRRKKIGDIIANILFPIIYLIPFGGIFLCGIVIRELVFSFIRKDSLTFYDYFVGVCAGLMLVFVLCVALGISILMIVSGIKSLIKYIKTK
jgi:hypothetical protein